LQFFLKKRTVFKGKVQCPINTIAGSEKMAKGFLVQRLAMVHANSHKNGYTSGTEWFKTKAECGEGVDRKTAEDMKTRLEQSKAPENTAFNFFVVER
jgi:hypothetical protein